MALPSVIADQTVIRLRAVSGADDSHGNPTLTWTDQLTITGCSVQPIERATGGEFIELRQTVVTRWGWWGPPDADVTSTDRIIFDGVTFEVDGPVNKWPAMMPHKSAVLKRVDE